MMIMGEIVNYKNTSQFIYSVTDIEYIPNKVPNMLDAYTSVLDVGICGGTDAKKMSAPHTAAEKKFSATSRPMTITQDGWFIHKSGHLHDVSLLVKGQVLPTNHHISGR
jgi:hypothetical protein